MVKKGKAPRIAPDEYRKALQKTELESIMLDSCSVKTNRDKISANMKLDIRHKATYSIQEKTSAVITSSYNLVVATTTTRKDFALKIAGKYSLLLTSEEAISEDFIEVFVKINVQMNTWPYFRELVQNMVQRAGLPPLTLPLLKR